jgi:outer membrane protein assembly factor BamD (BamD/ComL family)
MLKRFIKLCSVSLAALVIASGTTAHAAPPGWEMREGSWVPVIQPGTGTPEAEVAEMIQQLKTNHTGELIKHAKKWIKTNKSNPLVPQVLLLQGDAEVLRGNKYKALYSYEDILNNFPTSELYTAVLQKEYDIADAFLKGYKRKFFGFRILPVTDDAVELLDRIQDRQRGSPLAEQAGIRVADYYYDSGDFQEAIDSYNDFLKRYPYSQYVRKAEVRRAEASLGNFHGILFDVTPLLDSRERLAAISQVFPQTAEGLQVNALEDRIYQLEGRKELEVARYYYRAGRHYAAAYFYKRVIQNWPDTLFAQDAKKELRARMPNEVGK